MAAAEDYFNALNKLEELQSRLETAQNNVRQWEARLARAQAEGNQATIDLARQRIELNQADVAKLTASIQQQQSLVDSLKPAADQELAARDAATKKATEDQGPTTQSAGEIQTTDATNNNQTQAPPAEPENLDDTGDIVFDDPAPASSNADPPVTSEQVPEISAPPPILPSATSPTSGGEDNPTDLGTVTVTASRPPAVAPKSTLATAVPSDSQQFYVYKAITVRSTFSGGKFTQDLEGVVLQIPLNIQRNQSGVLVPTQADDAATADQVRQSTAAADVTTRSPTITDDPYDNNLSPYGEENDPLDPDVDTDDPSVFGAAQNSPVDSEGQEVAVTYGEEDDEPDPNADSINLARDP